MAVRCKCIALFSVVWLLATAGVAADEDGDRSGASIVNCRIQQHACSQTHAGQQVTLDIRPRPVKAMADLTFRVSIHPELQLPRPPWILLNMPAMDMGENRVLLKPVAPGVYQGRGVVVRCRSGLRTWRATVVLPDAGTVDFIFDVVY